MLTVSQPWNLGGEKKGSMRTAPFFDNLNYSRSTASPYKANTPTTYYFDNLAALLVVFGQQQKQCGRLDPNLFSHVSCCRWQKRHNLVHGVAPLSSQCSKTLLTF